MRPPQSPVRPHLIPAFGMAILRVARCMACLIFASGVVSTVARAGTADTVHYSASYLPILRRTASPCHGRTPGSQGRPPAGCQRDCAPKGRARDRARQERRERADQRVTSKDLDELMPPPESGKKLTARQIELLKKWIDQGATGASTGRSSRSGGPRRPRCTDRAWVSNPIDRFVLARLESGGPAPLARRPMRQR